MTSLRPAGAGVIMIFLAFRQKTKNEPSVHTQSHPAAEAWSWGPFPSGMHPFQESANPYVFQ